MKRLFLTSSLRPHGITINKDDEGMFNESEPKLNELGFSTIRFDFRAHGKSTGDSIEDFNISGELIDLETIFLTELNKN